MVLPLNQHLNDAPDAALEQAAGNSFLTTTSNDAYDAVPEPTGYVMLMMLPPNQLAVTGARQVPRSAMESRVKPAQPPGQAPLAAPKPQMRLLMQPLNKTPARRLPQMILMIPAQHLLMNQLAVTAARQLPQMMHDAHDAASNTAPPRQALMLIMLPLNQTAARESAQMMLMMLLNQRATP